MLLLLLTVVVVVVVSWSVVRIEIHFVVCRKAARAIFVGNAMREKTRKIYARAIAHHKLSKCFFGDLLAQIEF